MTFRGSLFLALALCGGLAACGSQAVYTGESFSSDSPFKLRVDSDIDAVCESARRALLGQGYLIDKASSETIRARKATRRGDNQSTFIEMNVVCLPESRGSTLFATGLLSEYALKKSTSSASVGVSALGSISVPIGQSADSLVKVSEETIDDKEFYQRFFAAVTSILEERQPPRPAAEPVAPAPPAPDQQTMQRAVPAPALEPIDLETLPTRRPDTPLSPLALEAMPRDATEQAADVTAASADRVSGGAPGPGEPPNAEGALNPEEVVPLEHALPPEEELTPGEALEPHGTVKPEEALEPEEANPDAAPESLQPIIEETEESSLPLDAIKLLDV